MRVLVCGSRTWTDYDAIYNRLALFAPDTVIVHGGASGADTLAAIAGRTLGFGEEAYYADWARYGRRAGHLRNARMLDTNPGLVLAFWRDRSPGTTNTLDGAHTRGIPVEIHEWPN